MTCSVFRQVGATYQGLWTKARKNAEGAGGVHQEALSGLDKAPKYVSPTLSYVYGRDYSLRSGHQVSLLTLCGRIHIRYQGYRKHVALLHQGARLGGAKLWYDRSKKRFYLLISMEIETPDPAPVAVDQVIGVDVGQRYLATVATTTGVPSSTQERRFGNRQTIMPVCKATSAERHSQRHSAQDRAGAARETVEAEHQPHHQQADCGQPSPRLHRPRRLDPHP